MTCKHVDKFRHSCNQVPNEIPLTEGKDLHKRGEPPGSLFFCIFICIAECDTIGKISTNEMREHLMDRLRAPLFEALMRHAEKGTSSFHVPGHKHGLGLDPQALEYYNAITKLDLTELYGLDDLHQPEGVIAEAQQLAARCFGAEQTYFLVNGSTVGNLASIMTICSPGDLLLVQRNVHKSVIHGLMLAGARAVFISPRIDPASRIAVSPEWADVAEAWEQYPEARGLVLTNPNYYGMGVDLRPYVDLAHQKGRPIIVDEAHGAHYGFHPKLPPSALSCGADLVIQSTHKMLTALTMASMLHVQGTRVDRERLARNLSVLQSSSPSYPLMASLDLSRRQLDASGPALFDEPLRAVEYCRQTLSERPGLDIVAYEPGRSIYDTLDPFKLTIGDATGTLSGYELQRILEHNGCYTELADMHYVLLAWSSALQLTAADHLLDTLNDILPRRSDVDNPGSSQNIEEKVNPAWAGRTISEPTAFSASKQPSVSQIPWTKAAGKRSAEMIIPYPPGIPVIYPGERISEAMVQELATMASMGAKFQGVADPTLQTVRVEQ